MSWPRRRSAVVAALACLGLSLGAAAVIVAIFHDGVLAGLALAGAGLVACAVPASLLGLSPGLGSLLDLIAALVLGLVSAVLSFLRSLFD